MNLDDSLKHKHKQQVLLHIRVLRKEPQLQIPLGIGKEPQLQIPLGIGKIVVPTHLRDQEDTGVDFSPQIHLCLILLFG